MLHTDTVVSFILKVILLLYVGFISGFKEKLLSSHLEMGTKNFLCCGIAVHLLCKEGTISFAHVSLGRTRKLRSHRQQRTEVQFLDLLTVSNYI
jgi:hypothetical protein